MKVRALHKFEGLLDLERTEREQKDVYPKAGDVWETSEERALYLKNHGVVEILDEEKVEEVVLEPITEIKKEGVVEILDEEKVEEVVLEPITEIKKEEKSKEEKKSQRKKTSKK